MKKFLNVKSEKQKAKTEKIIEMLKAKSKILILKTTSEKQKRKLYDFAF